MITPKQSKLISAIVKSAKSFDWGSGVETHSVSLSENLLALGAELARLNAEIERLNNDHSAAHALVAQYHNHELIEEYLAGSKVIDKKDAEIERLRGLVKLAEWNRPIMRHSIDGNQSLDTCPWCIGVRGVGHSVDCPAFTPIGDVR